MGKPYADDLRLVVVWLIGEGHTRPEVAELCGISPEFGWPLRAAISCDWQRQSGQVRRLQGLCADEVCRADQAMDCRTT